MMVRHPGQFVQFGENTCGAVLIHAALAGSRVQHGLDLIAGGEGQVDQVGSGRELSLAQPIENRLQIVRKTRDVVEAEHRARSLDRVQRPESPPYDFGIVAVLVQFQQRRFQFARAIRALRPGNPA